MMMIRSRKRGRDRRRSTNVPSTSSILRHATQAQGPRRHYRCVCVDPLSFFSSGKPRVQTMLLVPAVQPCWDGDHRGRHIKHARLDETSTSFPWHSAGTWRALACVLVANKKEQIKVSDSEAHSRIYAGYLLVHFSPDIAEAGYEIDETGHEARGRGMSGGDATMQVPLAVTCETVTHDKCPRRPTSVCIQFGWSFVVRMTS
jgi:hypothetical protein